MPVMYSPPGRFFLWLIVQLTLIKRLRNVLLHGLKAVKFVSDQLL